MKNNIIPVFIYFSIILILYGGCVLFYIAPDPPVISSSYNERNSEVTIECSRVAGASGYKIYVSEDGINYSLWTDVDQVFFGQKVSVFGGYRARMSPNRVYYFKAIAYNIQGESNFSNVTYAPYP